MEEQVKRKRNPPSFLFSCYTPRSGLADGYCVTRVAYILILYSLPILFTIFFFLTRCEIPSATHAFDLYSSDIQEMWRVVGGERKEINENASNSGRVMDISQRFFPSSFPLHIILSSFFLFRAMSRWKIKRRKINGEREATTSSCVVVERKSSFLCIEEEWMCVCKELRRVGPVFLFYLFFFK